MSKLGPMGRLDQRQRDEDPQERYLGQDRQAAWFSMAPEATVETVVPESAA